MKLTSTIAILLYTAAAWAEVPTTQQIEQDLTGQYATTRAQPALKQRGELARRIEPLLVKQCEKLLKQLQPWDQDSQAQFIFKGSSHEFDIRSAGHLACGLAVIYRAMPDDAASMSVRNAARDRAIAILRFALATHGAGGKLCTDKKQWKDQWQSAFWAHSLGKAAWLLWDDLDPQLRWLAAEMICHEADRFVGVTPPAQVKNDTKAEENAWNSEVISLAYNMFPRHKHHEIWRETAIRWVITSFATSKDVERKDVVDGKPLNEWLTKPNIYDDYTLENHNRVHPDYMCTTRLNLVQKFDYDWAGNPEPASLRFNADKVYASVKILGCPDGGWVYPNGQDWQLHRAPDWIDINAFIAILFNDPEAARLLRLTIDTTERMMARNADSGLFLSDEVLVPTSHAIPAELFADVYLLLRALGDGPAPVADDKLWPALSGKHVFANGNFAVLRSAHSVATFSWGSQVMGMMIPLRKDLLLTPNERSLIGSITMSDGKQDNPAATRVELLNEPAVLALSGSIDRAAGAIEQRFAFVALGDGRTIYADVLRMKNASTRPAAIDLGTLGVLNDRQWVYHNGVRTLHHDGGKAQFLAGGAASGNATKFSSAWFNLDGLGIVCLKSSGTQIYNARPSMTRGRLEQLFHLNHVSPEAIAAAGAAPFAGTVLVLYPNQAQGITQDMANKCKLEPGRDDYHFEIRLNDHRRIECDLENLKLKIQ